MMTTQTTKKRYCKLVIGENAQTLEDMDTAFEISSSKDEFLVAFARITEGISMIPRVELDAYSGSKKMKYSDLRKLLDQSARLVVRQTDNEYRFFVGVISQVKHLGICISSKNQKPIYHYRMVLTSILNNMKYVRQSRTFEDKTFRDVIQEILNYYDINVVFRCTAEDKLSFYSKSFNFYQRQESDYDFFRRILFYAGWSFCIMEQKNGDQTMEEMILITDGNCFSMEESDPQYDASAMTSENASEMNISDWSMEEQVSVESFVTSASDFLENGKRTWLLNSAAVLFSASSTDPLKKEFENQRNDILARYLYVMRQNCQGIASSLKLSPGVLVNLKDFYGPEEDALEILLSKDEIKVVDRLPEGYPLSSEEPGLTIQVQGIEFDSKTLPVFSDLATTSSSQSSSSDASATSVTSTTNTGTTLSSSTEASSGTDCTIAAPVCVHSTVEDAADNQIIFCATVCDKNGKYSGTDADGNEIKPNSVCTLADQNNSKGMFFYALLDGSTAPVLVQYTMAVGGDGQGLYRLPRLADRIAVVNATANRFILLSYLPSYENMPFVNSTSIGNSQQMTVLRHNVPAVVAGYIDNASDAPDPAKYNGYQYSEIGMYSESNSETMRLQTPGYRYDQAEKDHILTAANFLFSTPADNDKGTFNIAKVKQVNIQADMCIRLQVGRCFIQITETGVEIRARQTKALGGPQDSVVSIGQFGMSFSSNAVGIAGNRIGLVGNLGEGIDLGAGQVNIAASSIAIGTTDYNYIKAAQVLLGGMCAVNSLVFAAGIADDVLNRPTFADIVSGKKIQTSTLKKMDSNILDALSQYIYMGNGLGGTLISGLNVFLPNFSQGFLKNRNLKTESLASAFALIDSCMSGVYSGLKLFFPVGSMGRDLSFDILNFVYTEIKYVVYCVLSKGILPQKHHFVSYFRMDSENAELWAENLQVDAEKSDMRLFHFPATKSLTKATKQVQNDVKFLTTPEEWARRITKNLNAQDVLATTEDYGLFRINIQPARDFARDNALVKLTMDKESVTLKSLKTESESTTINLTAKGEAKIETTTKLTIKTAELSNEAEKMNLMGTTLSIKADKAAIEAMQNEIKGESLQFSATIIQA